MEGPSRKRLRSDATENNATASQSSLTQLEPTALDRVQAAARDSEYWFDDGNIILLSEGVAFRVYKGLLAEHSSVFRSMFYVAQAPPDSADLVEGCPVINLYDSPNDLRGLFRLIFPLSKNLKFDRPKIDINFISAIIRLDHKYELKGLYEQAMGYLTSYYTTNFDTWVYGKSASEWKPESIHAIGAINLARLTNTTSILPAAFYVCATLGPEVARGFAREDGSTERLSAEDLRICLELKAHLALENVHTAFLLFRHPGSLHCSNTQGLSYCVDLLRKMLEHAGLSRAPHPIASDRALDSWVDNIDKYTPPNPAPPPGHGQGPMGAYMAMYSQQARSLCKGCRNYIQSRDWEARRQIWRKLPEFVGLTIDDWDTVPS